MIPRSMIWLRKPSIWGIMVCLDDFKALGFYSSISKEKFSSFVVMVSGWNTESILDVLAKSCKKADSWLTKCCPAQLDFDWCNRTNLRLSLCFSLSNNLQLKDKANVANTLGMNEYKIRLFVICLGFSSEKLSGSLQGASINGLQIQYILHLKGTFLMSYDFFPVNSKWRMEKSLKNAALHEDITRRYYSAAATQGFLLEALARPASSYLTFAREIGGSVAC